MTLQISAILLASGLSKRMGGTDKLFLSYKGKTLLQHAVDLLDSQSFYEKILVTTSERLKYVDRPQQIRIIMNHNPEAGQSESLRLGVEAATGESYLFFAADQPRLAPTDLHLILASARVNKNKIIYPSIDGNPSTPTLFPASFRSDLLNLTGDVGGRAVRDTYPEACLPVEVECRKDFFDIDSEEDWKKMLAMG